MFLIISFIVIGIPIGYFLRKNEKVKKIVADLSTYTVYALLFFLGIQMGANDDIMSSLGSIGIKAFILAVCISLGSALAGLVVIKYLKGLEDKRGNI